MKLRERSATDPPIDPQLVLDIVGGVAAELRPGALVPQLDTSLERHLGLDSLARVEILSRLGARFEVTLADRWVAEAETPRDLYHAVLEAVGAPAATVTVLPSAAEVGRLSATPDRAETLLEVLRWHADGHADRLHIHFLGEAAEERLSYGALLARAELVATGLLERRIAPGDTVALMLPTGLEYFAAFAGVLLAGATPVPLYPPVRKSQIEDHVRRQASILDTAEVRLLIAAPEVRVVARLLEARVASLKGIATVEELSSAGPAIVLPTCGAQDIAFLQFTSGSTGTPKGVVLTHANLLANLRAMVAKAEVTSADVMVSWLPLYHDMGLIGAWMGSLIAGFPLVLMSPLSFLSRPSRWLWAIHHHRGTISAAPNFAYELVSRRVKDTLLEGLDLSSWRLALNGAEPVSAATLALFRDRFAPYGLRQEAITPVYGLAESSLGVAFTPPGRGPRIERVERRSLLEEGRAVPAADQDGNALEIVGCGSSLPGHEIRVVDEAGRELPERRIGRLEFSGPSASGGYYRNPEETAKLCRGEWRDSGDLAFIADGELYLTGRVKDVIIRGGRNLYPQELEERVGGIDGVRRGCVAIFGCRDAATGTERLVVMAETRLAGLEARAVLSGKIQAAAVELLGAPADEVVLAPAHTVLKTSSGKIRRASCREVYERGLVGAQTAAVGTQLTRLALSGATAKLIAWGRGARDWLFGAWAWKMLAAHALFFWPLIVLTPGQRWRYALMRVAGRSLFRCTGTPLAAIGIENLPTGPAVLVANHASYLDSFALAAVLPGEPAYVAKRELVANPLARIFLERIGTVFVERFDQARSLEDARRAADVARRGRSLIFFPEGTFVRAPGLQSFRLGAFLVACETGMPVVPIALRGTRTLLRAGEWTPRRGAVEAEILPPIFPDGEDWAAAARLAQSVRAVLLPAVGEPDLGHQASPVAGLAPAQG